MTEYCCVFKFPFKDFLKSSFSFVVLNAYHVESVCRSNNFFLHASCKYDSIAELATEHSINVFVNNNGYVFLLFYSAPSKLIIIYSYLTP